MICSIFSVNDPQISYETLRSIAQLEQLLRTHVHALGTMQERPQQSTNGANQRQQGSNGKDSKELQKIHMNKAAKRIETLLTERRSIKNIDFS
jgi:hypothetical protein